MKKWQSKACQCRRRQIVDTDRRAGEAKVSHISGMLPVGVRGLYAEATWEQSTRILHPDGMHQHQQHARRSSFAIVTRFSTCLRVRNLLLSLALHLRVVSARPKSSANTNHDI